MNWSDPAELKGRLVRLWERGELLREAIEAERFPLRLPLRGPCSEDITTRFEAIREWTAKLERAPHLRLEWREVRHRVQGSQRLPTSAWDDTLDAALAWLGLGRAWQTFSDQVEITRRRAPVLLTWLARHPQRALTLAPAWEQLLDVVDWIARHPRPGIHLRQVDIPGVHSKLIEHHRAVLTELLDRALDPASIASEAIGISRFAARYGFLEKPARIRFRALDPLLSPLPGIDGADLTLDADSFSRLALPARRIIITENEINFLTLPELHDTLALFGAGYGWEALARARWLERCTIHYWGDIDTHGFAILDRLRDHFPHVRSLLMDRATLLAHRAFWGCEHAPARHDLRHLDPEEQALYDELRRNRLGENLRLEQEHLGFGWVKAHIAELASGA